MLLIFLAYEVIEINYIHYAIRHGNVPRLMNILATAVVIAEILGMIAGFFLGRK